MSTNTRTQCQNTSSHENDDVDDLPSPDGRLVELPSGRVGEVIDVVDAADGRKFKLHVLDLSREVTIKAETARWVGGDG